MGYLLSSLLPSSLTFRVKKSSAVLEGLGKETPGAEILPSPPRAMEKGEGSLELSPITPPQGWLLLTVLG